MTRHHVQYGAVVAGFLILGAILVSSREPAQRFDEDAVRQWEREQEQRFIEECIRYGTERHPDCAGVPRE